MTGKDTINKMAEKINKLELVKVVLYKHFARAIDKVVQQAIQNAAAELLTIIPPEYLEQLEESARKKDNEQNTPRGVNIAHRIWRQITMGPKIPNRKCISGSGG